MKLTHLPDQKCSNLNYILVWGDEMSITLYETALYFNATFASETKSANSFRTPLCHSLRKKAFCPLKSPFQFCNDPDGWCHAERPGALNMKSRPLYTHEYQHYPPSTEKSQMPEGKVVRIFRFGLEHMIYSCSLLALCYFNNIKTPRAFSLVILVHSVFTFCTF